MAFFSCARRRKNGIKELKGRKKSKKALLGLKEDYMDLLNLKLAYPKRTIQIVLFGIALFSFVGCSSTKPAPNPEETAQAQKPVASTKVQTNASVGQSSLEQLQQGGKVGTAPEGPL